METNFLDLIIELILNNTKLSYCDTEKLRIDDDNPVLEVIKVMTPERYEKRINELNGKNHTDKE